MEWWFIGGDWTGLLCTSDPKKMSEFMESDGRWERILSRESPGENWIQYMLRSHYENEVKRKEPEKRL